MSTVKSAPLDELGAARRALREAIAMTGVRAPRPGAGLEDLTSDELNHLAAWITAYATGEGCA